MKNYNNNEESSYIQYLDANNLYGWAISKKLLVNGFKWIDNNETDTDSFITNIKTNDFYKDITNDVENRFDTSNYEVNRPLPTGKNKKNHWFNGR